MSKRGGEEDDPFDGTFLCGCGALFDDVPPDEQHLPDQAAQVDLPQEAGAWWWPFESAPRDGNAYQRPLTC